MVKDKDSVQKVPLSMLREPDADIYPRVKPDLHYVGTLVTAIKGGAQLPPLIVDARTMQIVDGRHRYLAYVRLYGLHTGAEVPVRLVEYASEKEMLADAVRYNVVHGKRLDRQDLVLTVNRLKEFGYTERQIAQLVYVPVHKVSDLSRAVAYTVHKEPLPLKNGFDHLRGQVLTMQQVEAHNKVLGISIVQHIRQLLAIIRGNLLDFQNDEQMRALQELYRVLDSLFRSRCDQEP